MTIVGGTDFRGFRDWLSTLAEAGAIMGGHHVSLLSHAGLRFGEWGLSVYVCNEIN
jgi:hypothetical protein